MYAVERYSFEYKYVRSLIYLEIALRIRLYSLFVISTLWYTCFQTEYIVAMGGSWSNVLAWKQQNGKELQLVILGKWAINDTLSLQQYGRHFADDISNALDWMK